VAGAQHVGPGVASGELGGDRRGAQSEGREREHGGDRPHAPAVGRRRIAGDGGVGDLSPRPDQHGGPGEHQHREVGGEHAEQREPGGEQADQREQAGADQDQRVEGAGRRVTSLPAAHEGGGEGGDGDGDHGARIAEGRRRFAERRPG
jgi:hypothetical protein